MCVIKEFLILRLYRYVYRTILIAIFYCFTDSLCLRWRSSLVFVESILLSLTSILVVPSFIVLLITRVT